MKQEITETWVDIPGYEGIYRISNKGGIYNKRTNKYLKPGLCKGYYIVGLSKNGKQRMHRRCRLVAMAFIPNPDNLPCINHKDENPQNDCVENLEWCSVAYNNSYGSHPDKTSKKVQQYTLDGVFVKEYRSIRKAAAELHIDQSNISKHLKGHPCYPHAGGFIWRYSN